MFFLNWYEINSSFVVVVLCSCFGALHLMCWDLSWRYKGCGALHLRLILL